MVNRLFNSVVKEAEIEELLNLVEAQIQPLQVHEAFLKTWQTGPLIV
jgi:hypothetical protein